MTEADWLACADAEEMHRFLRYNVPVSDRKQRLWACACCRLVWHNLVDVRSKAAVQAAERFADGLATEDELHEAGGEAQAVIPPRMSQLRLVEFERLSPAQRTELSGAWAASAVTRWEDGWDFHYHVEDVIRWTLQGAKDQTFGPSEETVRVTLAEVTRDLFGRIPFRSVPFDRRWLTPDVLGLARAAYEERALPAGTLEPERLVLLADALEEAGCTNAEVLAHLRSAGPHVRGCWALDLVLGKS